MKTLDELIDCDEKVLFRASHGGVSSGGLDDLLLVAVAVGVVALIGLINLDRVGLASLGLIFAGPLSIMAWQFRDRGSCEGVVTERRLLHQSGSFRRKLTEVAADDVKRVKATDSNFRIYRRDDAPLDLHHPTDAWGLGVSLAHAAGVELPHLPTRKALLAELLHVAVAVTTSIAVAILPVTWLVEFIFAGASFPAALGLGAIGVVIGLLSWIPGIHMSGPMTLLLLRPFLSHREAVDWLESCCRLWPVIVDSKEIDWEGQLLRRLARVLYWR